jgi:hypothetical protein
MVMAFQLVDAPPAMDDLAVSTAVDTKLIITSFSQSCYNFVADTERPMKIELILDPTNQPLVNRVAPAAQGKATTKATTGAAGAATG